VALSGDTVVIGAQNDDDNGVDTGSAYVYIRSGDGWLLQAKLLADDGVAGDNFGFSVAVDGDTVVIGALNDDNDNGNNSGSAYVFIRSGVTWNQQAKLLPSLGDGATDEMFGIAVAVDGDTAVIGSWFDGDKGSRSGSAYVYIRSGVTWSQQAKLLADDGVAGDLFGHAVAVDGDTAVIGAYEDDDNGSNSGSAYVFIRSGATWSQQAKLLPSPVDGAAVDRFGYSVALSGDTAVIGSYWDDDNGDQSGSVYVFIRDGITWSQQAKLLADDGAAGDYFGDVVAVNGDTAVIGARQPNGENGSAYVFIRDGVTWSQQAKLLADDGAASDSFGRGVTVNGDTAVIGAHADDDNGGASGSAYVFNRDGVTWSQQNWNPPAPSKKPTSSPSMSPTTARPSVSPTTARPSVSPTKNPTSSPTTSSPTESPIPLITKLLPDDGAAADQFGLQVAVSGDTVVIGARNDDDNGVDSGSAYVYIRSGDGWLLQAKLLADDGVASDNFGTSVAVDGDTVVIGAYGGYIGQAYVFVRDGVTWSQQAKLLPGDGAGGDQFGQAVAVSGDTAVIGSKRDDDNGSDSGSAYVFVRDGVTWSQQAKLKPDDGAAGDHFGHWQVGVSGDTAVIGSNRDDDNGSNSGSAYVFVRSGVTWSQQAKLLPDDGAVDDYFGMAVTLSGDTAVICALNNDDNGSNSGSAYVFVRDGVTWSQQAKLLPDDGAGDDYFGFSVAVSGDTAVIGAYADDDNGGASGSAYVFIRSGVTWSQQAKLLADDGAASDSFGRFVAVSGDTAVIGALGDDDNGSDSGSAYVFNRDGVTWSQQKWN
jgi:hypothetical protein